MKKIMPKPVTLNDCLLVMQMGYEVEIDNGQVTRLIKKKKPSFLSAKKINLFTFYKVWPTWSRSNLCLELKLL